MLGGTEVDAAARARAEAEAKAQVARNEAESQRLRAEDQKAELVKKEKEAARLREVESRLKDADAEKFAIGSSWRLVSGEIFVPWYSLNDDGTFVKRSGVIGNEKGTLKIRSKTGNSMVVDLYFAPDIVESLQITPKDDHVPNEIWIRVWQKDRSDWGERYAYSRHDKFLK